MGAWVGDPVLQRALHGAAALLFLAAAIHKLRDRTGFRATLTDYRIAPAAAVPILAGFIAAAEFAVGIGCLIPKVASIACLVGAGMLLAYSAGIAVNLARGRRDIDCGCGGPGGARPLSGGLVARNAALVGLLLLAALPEGARSLVWLDALTATALLATLTLFYTALDVAIANTVRGDIQGNPA